MSTFLKERTAASIHDEIVCDLATAKKAARLLRTVMMQVAPFIVAGVCEADETYF